MKIKNILYIAVFLSFYAFPLRAADINIINIPDAAVDFITFQGPIVAGDADTFYRLADQSDKRMLVLLESTGGSVDEALKIGAKIRIKNFSTSVLNDKGCFSACALIWVAGVNRYMSGQARIGVHAAYVRENGQAREVGSANAVIGSYLTHLGLSIEAIRYFTEASPDDLKIITPSVARVLGIDINFIRDDGSVITPDAAPSISNSINVFASYLFLQNKCSSLFGYNKNVFYNYMVSEFNIGMSLVSAEEWDKKIKMEIDSIVNRSKDIGVFRTCIETEEHIRLKKLNTLIFGPSFECSNLSNYALAGICGDRGLWAKDKAINSVYIWSLRNLNKEQRRPFLETQRRWLKYRDSCGGDVGCLHEAYDLRIRDLSAVDLDN